MARRVCRNAYYTLLDAAIHRIPMNEQGRTATLYAARCNVEANELAGRAKEKEARAR